MSERAHFWIRLVALVVIVAVSWLPRGGRAPDAADAANPRRSVEVARK